MALTIGTILMKVDLQEALNEELNIEEVFGFDIAGFHIGFDEGTVVSWIIIAVLTLLAIILTRNLKVTGEISKRQQLLELAYEKGYKFFYDIIGEKGKGFIPWLMSVALFIGFSNIIGLFGMKPPTKSMQVTLVLALTSLFVVEYSTFKAKGIKGRIKALTKPIWIITPINIMEIFTKPLSLCMRLFGNVLAAFTIMKVVEIAMGMILPPIILPTILSLYFDIFDGLLQAYIFVFLTSLYIKEATEEEEISPEKQKKLQEKAEKKAAKKAAKEAKKQAKSV